MDFIEKVIQRNGSSFFKSLAESLPHTVLIIHPKDFKILYLNRIQSDYRMEDVIGQEVFAFVWPEYHHLYRERIAELIKTGKVSIN